MANLTSSSAKEQFYYFYRGSRAKIKAKKNCWYFYSHSSSLCKHRALMLSLRHPKTNKRSTRDTNGLQSDQRKPLHFDPYGIRHMRRGNHSFWLCMNGCMCLCLSVCDRKSERKENRNAPKSSTIFNLISRKWKSSSPLLFPNTTTYVRIALHYFFPIRFVPFTSSTYRTEWKGTKNLYQTSAHIFYGPELKHRKAQRETNPHHPSRYINIKKEKRKIIWSTVISYTMTS